MAFFFTYAFDLNIIYSQSNISIRFDLMIFSHSNVCLKIKAAIYLDNTHHSWRHSIIFRSRKDHFSSVSKLCKKSTIFIIEKAHIVSLQISSCWVEYTILSNEKTPLYRTRCPILSPRDKIVWLQPVFEPAGARCRWHSAFRWVRVLYCSLQKGNTT